MKRRYDLFPTFRKWFQSKKNENKCSCEKNDLNHDLTMLGFGLIAIACLLVYFGFRI